jgi:hypothetical protein
MLTTTTGGTPATVDVGDAVATAWPAAGSPSTVTATGSWTTPGNANSATGTAGQYATAVVSSTTGYQTGTTATADSSFTAVWASLANAQGGQDNASATVSVPAKSGGTDGHAGLYLSYSGFGGAPPAGATLLAATAKVYWSADQITPKLVGTLELHKSNGTLVATGTTATGQAPSTTSTGTSTSFTFTQAQLAGMSTTDLASTNADLVRFWVDNSDNSAHAVNVDAITIKFDYLVSPAPSLTLTNFGISIPSTATITSVVVTVGMGALAANANAQVAVQAYKNATTLNTPYATTAVTQTPTTSIAAETLTLDGSGHTTIPTASDLASGSFGVVITPTVTTSGSFTLNVQYVSVTINFTQASSQSIVLTNFGLQNLLPSVPAPVIDTIELDVDWKINASNNKATLTAQPYKGGSVSPGNAIGSLISVNPTASYATTTMTYTNTSGAITAADLADGNFIVSLGASTTGSGFQASIDMVRVIVTYTAPATSAMTLGGFGFNVPSSGSFTLTVIADWDVSTRSPGTEICFQPFNGATALGSPACTTTTGVSPSTSLTQQLSTFTGLAAGDVNNLSVQVTATHSAGGTPVTVNVDYVEAQVTNIVTTTSGVDECDYQNNWSVAKSGPGISCPTTSTYGAFQYSRVFGASCPAGTRPRWQLFFWDSTDPSDSTIAFRFRTFDMSDGGTCSTLPGVFSGTTPPPLVTAESRPNNTQTCSVVPDPMTTTCPAVLSTYLGGVPTSDYPCLQMDVTGQPSSSGTQTPTLTDWTVKYDCLVSE